MSRKIPACDLKKGHKLVKRNSAGRIRWLEPIYHVEQPPECGLSGFHINYEYCFLPFTVVEVK